MIGPLAGPLGTWAAVIPCLNTSGSLLRSVERDSPELAELAREVAVALQGRDGPGTATEALRRVWDLLTSATDPESATQPP
jgi:hypothetical protein